MRRWVTWQKEEDSDQDMSNILLAVLSFAGYVIVGITVARITWRQSYRENGGRVPREDNPNIILNGFFWWLALAFEACAGIAAGAKFLVTCRPPELPRKKADPAKTAFLEAETQILEGTVTSGAEGRNE